MTQYIKSVKHKKASFIRSVVAKKHEIKECEISEIFSAIRNDLELIKITEEYHKLLSNDADEAKKFKRKNFPAYFPTLCLYNIKNELTEDSRPTGLIQFDLDKKDNLSINLEELKQYLLTIPELYSLFVSLSGGLKFSISTDFHKHKEESLESFKKRYKIAYNRTKEHVLEKIGEVKLDDAVKSIKYACFISHDSDAYLNESCKQLEVDALIDVEHERSSSEFTDYSNITVSEKDFAEVLKCIPADFSYNERLPVNNTIFNIIGESGKAILFDHWTTSNREKLRSDLNNQFNSLKSSSVRLNFAYLLSIARKNGYAKAATGRARKKLAHKEIENSRQIPELLNLDEAREKVEDTIRRFFETSKDIVIASSLGIGKSELTLKFLAEFFKSVERENIKILYVSNNHKLLEELFERFLKMIKPLKNLPKVTHIQGKNRLCINTKLIENYEEIPIPWQECVRCSQRKTCSYIKQYNQDTNIRFTPTNELYNNVSFFDKNWKPDFIIIDEDCLKIENFVENQDFKSLRMVGEDVENDIFFEAILKDYDWMVDDFKKSKVKFKNTEDYIESLVENRGVWCEILDALYKFLITNDESYIRGLRVVKTDNKSFLKMSRIKKINKRFDNVPKLFLDATADEIVFKTLFPSIEFVSVYAEKNETVKVIQAENFNVTKTWAGVENNRLLLVESLKRYIGNGNQYDAFKAFDTIGIVTYKNAGDFEDFDEYLAEQLNAVVWGHFGNIRGVDAFKDCDLVIEIGRLEIRPVDLENWCYAVFNQSSKDVKREYVPAPFRMSGGQFCTIENLIYHDDNVESIRNQVCRAETLQGAGRIRWFQDHPGDSTKILLILSCESLGLNFEVDEFMRFDDLFKEPQKSAEEIKVGGIAKSVETKKKLVKEKMLGLLADEETTVIQSLSDNCTAFKERGFKRDFAENKTKRREFMTEVGYELIDKVWKFAAIS